ncbi:deoxyguanosinetriphosphate triphosphohydrolase family protein [Dactylosporangium sp. CA-152071]|uniref:deoxyguanosinetriphosphate triphosphohydrolase family protein n=1 Tax=Dactylosporangium sp. CA-152071 TaxID=3239933 RepID=UPI003D8BA105
MRESRLFGGRGPSSGDLTGNPFRADRDRIVASPFFARLGGVTQVISPGGSGLLVHNRLTHSLKVASVARGIVERLCSPQCGAQPLLDKLGGCDADVVEAAALAHDLGHPPFGHLGERVLDRLARQRLGLPDGFEGNAQSYRIVTSTEISGSTVGLDLTAAVRAAMAKYPWTRRTYPSPHVHLMRPTPRGAGVDPEDPSAGSLKFGAYVTELADLRQARAPFDGLLAQWQQTAEASVMDTADDIAYAIHDLEDFHRVGVLQQGAVATELMAWQRDATALRSSDLSLAELRASARRPGHSVELLRRDLFRKDGWISDDDAFWAAVEHVRHELVDGLLAAPFDGSIEAEQGVARFSARWTRRLIDAINVLPDPPMRAGHVALGTAQWHEVQVLKFVHHRFVLERPDLALHQRGQARLLSALVEALHAWLVDPDEAARLPRRLHDLVDMAYAEVRDLTAADYGLASGDLDRMAMARGRAIVDFVAALTDGQAVGLLDALSGRSRQLWTDAFVL